MNEQELKEYVDGRILHYMATKQFQLSKIPIHIHDGVDVSKIDPKNLLGFPIVTVVPSDDAIDGTIRIYSSGGTYTLYVRVSNLWKSAALT